MAVGRLALLSKVLRVASASSPLPSGNIRKHSWTVLARRLVAGGPKPWRAFEPSAPCRTAAAAKRLRHSGSGDTTAPHARAAEPHTRGQRLLRAAFPSTMGA